MTRRVSLSGSCGEKQTATTVTSVLICRDKMATDGTAATKVEGGAVLSPEQQERLRCFKINTRFDNEQYLRSHPEVELLVQDFIRNVLLKRPTNIREFAANHFINPDLERSLISRTGEDGVKE